jgi:hypothetical protein
MTAIVRTAWCMSRATPQRPPAGFYCGHNADTAGELEAMRLQHNVIRGKTL